MKANEEAIFEQARRIKSENERLAYVRGACSGDAELFDRVQNLLRVHFEAEGFMATEISPEPSGGLSEGPGSQIGRYKILQEIGHGGMGVVYMAEQTEPVNRRVALKIIKLGMDTKNVVARFEAERQALAMMDHPNIARVLDGGTTESGRPYFVMELVKGAPITEFADKNKLDAHARLELFIQVCRAVQSAHQKGVIHRDLKPSNILVTLHHGEPMPKIIDFGIAKATNHKLTEKTLFTNFAQMIGTPAYMSPEQAEMSSMDIDTRTDVYSLGVLLYELLTGTTPFPEKELLSKGYGEMQRMIAEQEPERPSLRMSTLVGEQHSIVTKNRAGDLPLLTKQLRGDLDWIIMKALEKDRTRRYDTANGLGEDIRRHLNSEPVLAAKPTIRYQVAKLYHRNKAAFAAAAGIMLAMVVGTIAAAAQAQRANQARDEAKRAQSVAEAARTTALHAERNEKDLRKRAQSETERALKLAEEQRLNTYVADMKNADILIQENDFITARKILQQHRPASEHETDLRGFEWRYLWDASRDQALRKASFLPAPKSEPNSELTLSHDQKRVVIRTGPRRIVVLDTATFDVIADIQTEGDHRDQTVFSPDDTRLYTFVNIEPVVLQRPPESPLMGHRMALHIYETTHWTVVARIDNAYPPLHLSPSGDPVFARYRDHERTGEFSLYQVVDPMENGSKMAMAAQRKTGEYEVVETYDNIPGLRSLPSPYQPVAGITLHRHWGKDDAWSLWDLSSTEGTKLIQRFPLSMLSPMAQLSPNGNFFASLERREWVLTKGGQRIRVFHCETGEEIPLDPPKPAITDLVRAMAFDSSSSLLLVGGNEQRIHVWNVNTGEHLGAMPGHPIPIDALAVAGEEVIVHYASGDIAAWNLEAALAPEVPWQSIPTIAEDFDSAAAQRAPNRYLLDGLHPRFREMMTSGQLSWRLPPPLRRLKENTQFRISPSGRFLATAELDFANPDTAQFGNIEYERPRMNFRFHEFQLSTDWNPLQSNVESRKNPASFWDGEDTAVFVGSNHVLFEASTGVELWDLIERKRISLPIGQPLAPGLWGPGYPMADLNGDFLAVGHSKPYRAAVWNHREKRLIAEYPFNGWIKQVRFSPGGDFLFISGQGQAVSGIEIATGEQRYELPGHRGETSVNFSPDGETILTMDNSGIRLWNKATGREMTRINFNDLPTTTLKARQSVGFTNDGQSLICEDFEHWFSESKLMMLTPRLLEAIDAEIEAELALRR